MAVIDAREDGLGDVDDGILRVRELISGLELCHHKADRWVENIVAAIAAGDTDKGLGTRPTGRRHPAEEHWRDVSDELSRWCSGEPSVVAPLGVPLGERTRLTVWQVERVAAKIRSWIDWPAHDGEYDWLVLADHGIDDAGSAGCPEAYRDDEDLWRATVRTTISDSVDGHDARLSLGLAIDMLWPCHWRFEDNARIVLAAIGGDLSPRVPFAACGRNLGLLPHRPRLHALCRTLTAFGDDGSSSDVDQAVLTALGAPTPERRWLAASLEKTIRLQLDPPSDVRQEMVVLGLVPTGAG